MSEFINIVINGVSVGSIFLMAALGLTIVFGLMGVINMAHGEFIMIGAYCSYLVSNIVGGSHGISVLLGLVASFVVTGAIGFGLERLIIRHLYGRPEDSLLVTWGISLILQQLAKQIFGAPAVSVTTPSFLQGGVNLSSGVQIPYVRIAIFIIAVLITAVSLYTLAKTGYGRQVRAVMQNRPMAASLGVNTNRVDSMTFAIGAGIAGIAGCALTWIGSISPTLGQDYVVNAFITVVIGGAGSILGTIFGSAFMGVGQTTFEFLSSPTMGQVIVYALVFLFLQLRPKGMFSRAVRDED